MPCAPSLGCALWPFSRGLPFERLRRLRERFALLEDCSSLEPLACLRMESSCLISLPSVAETERRRLRSSRGLGSGEEDPRLRGLRPDSPDEPCEEEPDEPRRRR